MTTLTPEDDCDFTVRRVNFVGIGDTDRAKLSVGIVSRSIAVTNTARNAAGDMAQGTAAWTATVPGSTLRATADVNPARTGTAAGYADDPYTVTAGSYPYSVTIDSLQLQDVPGGTVIAEFDAKSNAATNGTLWDLLVEIDPEDTLSVTFTSFSPLGLGMSDMSVGDAFETALDTSIPYQATLASPFTLFTTTLSSNTNFTYQDAVGTLATIPEPPGWAASLLFGSGLIVLTRRRSRGVGTAPRGPFPDEILGQSRY